MDFEFSAEQEQLRETVRRFLREQAPMSYVRSMLDDPAGTSREVWRGLADLGVTGLLVPERHGGAGMGMTDMGVVLEELGRAAHPGPFLSSAVGAVSALVAVSGPDGDELLPALADGSTIATVALHDEGGRGTWRTPATVAKDGALTGTKVLVPDALGADVLLVTAVTDDGIGLFAVDASAAGVAMVPADSPDGTRKLATVQLDGAPGRRVGDGDATEPLAGVVDRLLVAHVVDGVGAASEALDLAVAYTKERKQFGQPIGAFQAVQHLCAGMLQTLEMGRAGAYFALWAADEADAAELHRAATMAKAWASDAFFSIGADAIQVFGGIGYTWEHDIHLLYKRLLTLQHVLGTTPDHLEALAKIVIDP
jgi:alkylation response protein AidB-like acyl-CoA dehydrogenase